MKYLQLALHLSVVLFHQCQAQSLDGHCQSYSTEGRVACVDASADQLANGLKNVIVDGAPKLRELSIRESDVSAFLNLKEYSHVEQLELINVRMGDGTPISLSQLLSKFPELQLLILDNSKEKITLTRETFMLGQPIVQLIFSNDGLTDADIDSDAFENIKQTLKALKMRENQLTYLPSAITGLSDLRDLDFTGNAINYFSEETTKQLKSLPQLQSINLNDIDCQCHLLKEGFPTFVREKRIIGVQCSAASKFPGARISEIDVDQVCGSNQMKVAVLALIVAFLRLVFM